ncbi:hypothetical protein BOX37_17110 [Nocardia mangyaensis]|uniref:acetolactate synthase n=2 Tax=Nocardia mangyaensis TaxID=2213200 RepID=A0A1J0VTK5_9NOCA|nr:hypothetical protein BOX37_17110 [Nocardia mangyaensis]
MLEQAGVEVVFGLPGGPILPLFEALDSSPRIRLVLAKHEEGAVFMAEGYAQAGGRLGVAVVTSGPGATHAVTATGSADSDHVPVLVLSGQVATNSFGRGPVQDSSGAGACIDTVAVFRSATKLSTAVTTIDQLPHLLQLAIRSATAPVPGAVHLSVTADVLRERTAAPTAPPVQPVLPPRPASIALARAVAALGDARHPAVLAGQGAKLSGCGPELVALADQLSAPVATTFKGKSVFPEDHPAALGVFGTAGGCVRAHELLLGDGIDLLLVVGSSMGEFSTYGWDPRLVRDRVVIQIDSDPVQLGRNFPIQFPIWSDARTTLQELLSQLPKNHVRDSLWPQGHVPSTARQWQGTSGLLKASAVVAQLSERCPDVTDLFVDNGNCFGFAGPGYRSGPDRRVHCSLNLASMGYSVPAAIGGKLATPTRSVLALVGDAAFAMTAMEIHTAVEIGAAVIWVVLNNGGNAMVANVQQLIGLSITGSMYRCPLDVAAVATALGATARVVTSLDQLGRALDEAFALSVPYVIDARVDADEVPWAVHGRVRVLAGSSDAPETAP